MGAAVEWGLAGQLRLPPSRSSVDLVKLVEQYREFGGQVVDMPPIEVTRCRNGVLMINDGVTRATLAFRFAGSDALVPVTVIDERPAWDVGGRPRVGDR